MTEEKANNKIATMMMIWFLPTFFFGGVVEEDLYRSRFSEPSNFPFLETLNLKSFIYLCPEPYPEEHRKSLESHNIRLF